MDFVMVDKEIQLAQRTAGETGRAFKKKKKKS
jgi:hypothetical protein